MSRCAHASRSSRTSARGRPRTRCGRSSRTRARAGVELRFDAEEAAKHGVTRRGRRRRHRRDRSCPTSTSASRSAATARSCARCGCTRSTGVPVFAVNFGEVGFLATVDPDELTEGFRRAFLGEFETPRAARRSRCASATASHLAFNDVSLHRRMGDRVAELVLLARRRGGRLGALRRDRRLHARPGSTGYNLANGGPVMAWGVEGFGVSFIAPHSLTARSLVVAPDDVLRIATAPSTAWTSPSTGGPAASSPRASEVLARFVPDAAVLAQQPGLVLLPQAAGEVRPAVPVGVTNLLQRPDRLIRRDPLVDHRRVLTELRVENLLLIERAELRLAPGLNVLTGETGAGKTVLAHALDLLLGGKARTGIVRPGARGGVRRGRLRAARRAARRAGRAPAGGRRGGRARAARQRRGAHARARERPLRLGVRPARARRAAHRLLRPARAPPAHARLVAARGARRRVRAGAGDRGAPPRSRPTARCVRLEAALEELRERSGARERELDLLEFELREIEEADPSEEEDVALRAERDRLRHVEALRAAALGAVAAVAGDSEGGADGAGAALGAAGRELDALAGVDARARRAGRALARARRRGRGPGRRDARLRRGARRRARPARRRRGAPRAARPARPQARRHGRGGARARRALPGAARRAAGRRGGARGGDRGAGARTRRARPAVVRAARRAGGGGAPARRGGPRAAGVAGDGGRRVRDLAHGARARAHGRRRRRVPHRAERRRARGAAAGDRVGRRAVARHARAHGRPRGIRRRDGRERDARVRRGRRRHRRADRAGGRASSCARSPRAARSSASPTCRRSPRWPTGTSRSRRIRPPSRRSRPSPSCRIRRSSRSSCACSAPTTATTAPAATPKSC